MHRVSSLLFVLSKNKILFFPWQFLDLEEDMDKTLHIKGQMIFVPEWDQMLFLACPIMKDLNNLIWTGLFVNDLSMHDYSR